VRRILNEGTIPYSDQIRIEEMVNYFDYNIDGPSGDEVIHVTKEIAQAPWNENHQLLMLGLKTEAIDYHETDPMNLVFLIDVSGSMSSSDKLPLIKEALKILVDELNPEDRISIVTYASSVKVILNGGSVSNKTQITRAINKLSAGGSTFGSGGLELAYEVAQDNFIDGGNNRILLSTDGDFNVGLSGSAEMTDYIAEKRDTGIFLSVLGFGTGNLKNDTVEAIADNGNGVYYYIDSIKEAEKVFVHELGATMVTVAKVVKLQVEFNPVNVKGYRLIGYENRLLDYEEFDDDQTDAGDMGAGHEVIAFYEIIPANSTEEISEVEFTIPEDLRYDGENYTNEFLNVAIRYKDPNDETSVLNEYQVFDTDVTTNPSETFRFASSVVEFALVMKESYFKYDGSYETAKQRAAQALGDDEYGYRADFLDMIQIAIDIASTYEDNIEID